MFYPSRREQCLLHTRRWVEHFLLWRWENGDGSDECSSSVAANTERHAHRDNTPAAAAAAAGPDNTYKNTKTQRESTWHPWYMCWIHIYMFISYFYVWQKKEKLMMNIIWGRWCATFPVNSLIIVLHYQRSWDPSPCYLTAGNHSNKTDAICYVNG